MGLERLRGNHENRRRATIFFSRRKSEAPEIGFLVLEPLPPGGLYCSVVSCVYFGKSVALTVGLEDVDAVNDGVLTKMGQDAFWETTRPW